MKLKMITAFTLLLASQSFAQTPSSSPAPSLSDNMDSISTLVRSISKNVSDATQNTSSAAQAGQLAALFTVTLTQVPDEITALPAAQQATAMSGYQSLIQKEIDDADALQKAFLAGDNASAATILQDMNSIKSQGHSAFAK